MNNNKSMTSRRVLGQFFRTTTLHGFKYLLSDIYLDRIGWAICCIASTCCAGLLCAVLWARFQDLPAVLQLHHLDHNPALPDYTPDVAVCAPAHPVVSSFIKQLNLSASGSSALSTTIERVLTGKSAERSQLKMLEELLASQNLTLIQFLNEYSPECGELIIKCRWQWLPLPCTFLFEKKLTSLGPCCLMNADRAYHRLVNVTVRPTTRFGQVRTLDLSLQCSNETNYGCKLFVKYEGESNEKSMVLAPGHIYFAQVVFTSVPVTFSEYLSHNCISNETYSEEMCRYKCAEKYCGCSDPMYGIQPEGNHPSPCSAAHLACLRTYKYQSNASCECLPSCGKMSSEINMESSPLYFENFIIDPMYDGLSTDSTVIHMRLNIPMSKIFSLSPTETWLTLLSSLGGVFNMFLGVGLFSALEVLSLFFLKLPMSFLQ